MSGHHIDLRVGSIADMAALQEIDLDASELFAGAGLDVDLPAEFSQAELSRWLQSLTSGQVILAVDAADHALGFAARGVLDGEPYLDQLSVRRSCMRQGIGRSLLEAAAGAARDAGAHALWLTTYGHLSWNRPYYERAGFVAVSETDCGPDLRSTLAFERRFLPRPEMRVVMRKELGRHA